VVSELEQVDFFLDQELAADARELLDEIDPIHASHPEVWARRQRLQALPIDTPEPASRPPAPAASAFHDGLQEHVQDRLQDDLQDGGDFGEMAGAVPGGPYVEMFRGASGDPTSITPRAVVPAGDADATTHRDLGIAYKEMGLHDAAVAEFSKLVDDPEHDVFALTMMGECFESRGAPAEALLHYKRALNRPRVRDEEATQLYYQLGRVFHTLGDEGEALYFFEKVARRSPRHEDVAQRIEALRAQGVAPLPSANAGSAEDRHRFDAARGGTSNRR
jgi:tetratricopeptide (TPR) repeat protein